MIKSDYKIKNLSNYEKRRSSAIRHKIRNISKSYTIRDYVVDTTLKVFSFKRNYKQPEDNIVHEDKVLYHGYYSEDIDTANNSLVLTLTIRNMLPKNYEQSVKVSFPELHKFVQHKEETLKLISISSRDVFNWECDSGHQYKMSVKERINREIKDDACLCCNSLQTKASAGTLGKFNLKKNDLKPEEIRFNSRSQYYWDCNRCGVPSLHKIEDIESDKYVCPKCKAAGSSMIERRIFFYVSYVFGQKVLNGYRLSKQLGNKSVDIYLPHKDIAIEYDGVYWHRNKHARDLDKTETLEKNGIDLIRIREKGLSKIRNTDIDYDFKDKSGFTNLMTKLFERMGELTEMTEDHDNKLQKLIDIDFDESIVPKDFYYYPLKSQSLGKLFQKLAKQWSDKNSITPLQVSPTSVFNAWWDCDKCGFTYQKRVVSKTRSHNNTDDCPCCKVGEESIENYYPELAAQWSDNNKLPPYAVKHNSRGKTKFLFNCKCCNKEVSAILPQFIHINTAICNECYEEASKEFGLPLWCENKSVYKGRPGHADIWKKQRRLLQVSEDNFREKINLLKKDNSYVGYINYYEMTNKEDAIYFVFNEEKYYDIRTISEVTGFDKTKVHNIINLNNLPYIKLKGRNGNMYPEIVLDSILAEVKNRGKNIRERIGFDKSKIKVYKDKMNIKKDLLDVKSSIVEFDIEVGKIIGTRKSHDDVNEILDKLKRQITEVERKVELSKITTPYRKPGAVKVVAKKTLPIYLTQKNKNSADKMATYLAKKAQDKADKKTAKAARVSAPAINVKSNITNKNKAIGAYVPNYPDGTQNSGKWDKLDEDFLIINYPTKGRKFCANLLCRNESSVQKKITQFGLSKQSKTSGQIKLQL